MTDQEIIDIAGKHGLTLGMFVRSKLTDMGNGTLKYVPQNDLTFYGERLMSFARELLEKKL